MRVYYLVVVEMATVGALGEMLITDMDTLGDSSSPERRLEGSRTSRMQ
jgi:hypothetical protein